MTSRTMQSLHIILHLLTKIKMSVVARASLLLTYFLLCYYLVVYGFWVVARVLLGPCKVIGFLVGCNRISWVCWVVARVLLGCISFLLIHGVRFTFFFKSLLERQKPLNQHTSCSAWLWNMQIFIQWNRSLFKFNCHINLYSNSYLSVPKFRTSYN